jgi:hypothetical protein
MCCVSDFDSSYRQFRSLGLPRWVFLQAQRRAHERPAHGRTHIAHKIMPGRSMRLLALPGGFSKRSQHVPRRNGHETQNYPKLGFRRECSLVRRNSSRRCFEVASLFWTSTTQRRTLPARFELRLKPLSTSWAFPDFSLGWLFAERSLQHLLCGRQLLIIQDPQFRPAFVRWQPTRRTGKQAVANHTADSLSIEYMLQVVDHQCVLCAVDSLHNRLVGERLSV